MGSDSQATLFTHRTASTQTMAESLDAWFAREILVHEAALVRYLRRLMAWRDDVHDLRQETYIRVYEAAAKSRPQFAKSFLFTTARHLVMDRLRRERVVSIEPRADLDSWPTLVDEISPERQMSAHEELRSLSRAFDRLPPRCRQVVWLRRVLHLSQKEVSSEMGIAEGMVEKHLAKAMRRLTNAIYGARPADSTGGTRKSKTGDDNGKQQRD
jgi:RNA polymerase sigma factor (sigma-70 family)